MVKPRIRRPSSFYLAPSPRALSPRPSSAFEDFLDLDCSCSKKSSDYLPFPSSTRRHTVMATQPPTLTEILLDVSPAPWSLSAFMAYLSQNHCMETLEFTLDAQRYAGFYNQLVAEIPPSRSSNEQVRSWWEKLMQVYIIPCAPREVNIPARVRDRLLNLRYDSTPPHPSQLDEAGRIVFDLMNDSLLVPFLQSATAAEYDGGNGHRHAHHAADSEGLTDDSDSYSPTSVEPMTPPTTPPTSEWTFNSSPGGLQRAVAAHSKGWKKVGAKLGFNRKASNRRPNATSSSGA